MENSESSLSEERVIGRRTIVKGAAWSIPIIATATAVPQAAASTGGCSGTVRVTGYGQARDLEIPPCATIVTYEIAGAGGGYTGNAPGPDREADGGRGALLTGTLTGVAGQTLHLIPGNPGESSSTTKQALGGSGYGPGRGGHSGGLPGRPVNLAAAAGGGASGIGIGSVPLVVAGAGGGAGTSIAYRYPDQNPVALAGPGGDAGQPGGTSIVRNSVADVSAQGGQPGAGRVGGAGGAGTTQNGWEGGPESGGSGVLAALNEFSAMSGGGGSGYGGGGSGGISIYAQNDSSGQLLRMFIGGGGGGGGSYVNPAYATMTTTDHADNNGKGAARTPAGPGWIVITYS